MPQGIYNPCARGCLILNLHDKLLEVCRLFKIEYEFLGYETIQMGNVNKTYKVNFLLPDGRTLRVVQVTHTQYGSEESTLYVDGWLLTPEE